MLNAYTSLDLILMRKDKFIVIYDSSKDLVHTFKTDKFVYRIS